MPSKDLTFRVFGEDVNASLALRNIAAEADKSSKSIKGAFGALPTVVTAAFAGATIASVKLASDFQLATTQLVTGAGESEANLAKVKDGLLAMAPAVGIGPTALAKAMFLVESAGYHGAEGLNVMKAAAEGAKIGGADATVVANALTTVLTDFHRPAKDAATVTSELVAAVASGKTNMADLAGSLSTIAPSAASAGISLNEMLGALGTMTGEGISAQQSSQDLAATIASLSNPTSVQTKAMAQMGISSLDVAKNLGKSGLTGTFDTLATAILKHMGPSGLVLQSSFNESKIAAASAQEMLNRLPKSLQNLGKEFLNNQITQKEWSKALKGQDVLTSNLGKEFATTAKQANGFSDSLKSGGGSAQTFNGLLADMTGGQTGLATGLALTGKNMATFKSNVDTIGKAATEAGGHVKGWAETQKDFTVQMEQASASVQAMGIKIGTALLPILSQVLKVGKDWTDWLTAHQPVMVALIAVVGLFVTAIMAVKVAEEVLAIQAMAAKVALELQAVAQAGLTAVMDANPIGVVAAAIGVLAAVAGGIALGGTKDLTQATQNYTTALGDNSASLDENVRKVAAKALLDSGALAAAQKLGIATSTLVDATLGNKDAQKSVTDALKAQTDSLNATEVANGQLANGYSGLSKAQQDMRSSVGTLSSAFTDQSSALAAARKNADLYNSSLNAVAQPRSVAQISVSNKLATLSHHAAGGDIMHNEMAVVGENGPEVMAVPGGAHIYPTDTKFGGGGGAQINITMPPPQGFFIGTVADLAKAMNTQLIGGLRNGVISKTELRAALGI